MADKGHVGDTVQAIAEVHRRHEQEATRLQRTVDAVTATVSRPLLVVSLAIFIMAWMGGNAWLHSYDGAAIDPPPFFALEVAGTMLALLLAVLILSTQMRDDKLARRRADLTLELALLNERKTTKLIQLIEELRRDDPHTANRHDPEAEELANSADPKAVLDAIEDEVTGPRRSHRDRALSRMPRLLPTLRDDVSDLPHRQSSAPSRRA